MQLVAVVGPEVIESENGLHDIVVVDFFRRGPEKRENWIVYIAGVEVPVPRRATDDEIRATVEEQLSVFEQGPLPPPDDMRPRRSLISALIGIDIELTR